MLIEGDDTNQHLLVYFESDRATKVDDLNLPWIIAAIHE
jgi:hypothetical protein